MKDLQQVILAEESTQFLQFPGNGGIFIGQIGVVCAAVDDAQVITFFLEIKVDLLNDWVFRISKVNVDHAAHRRCHLIHQAARLTEVYILGVLSDLSNLNGAELLIEE